MLPTEYPEDIKRWLNKRGISDQVLNHNNISVVDRKIVIPVYSKERKLLFNKYRRDPFSEDGPKYSYDKGATAALYNANNLWLGSGPVVIVEGELDALRLQSCGHFAVSTTGGSGTFKEEWADLLKGYEVFICYDNDDAGILGTIRVLEVFPRARVICIPREPNVKDVTDYLSKHPPEHFIALFNRAAPYPFPQETSNLKDTKKTIAASLNSYRLVANEKGENAELCEAIIRLLQGRYDAVSRKIRYKRPEINDTEALARARAVPIPEYVELNKLGYAKCIAHNETTPSMKYYKSNNHVKCFGCSFYGDTIDVVQKIFSLSIPEAIKKINGN